MRIEDAAYDGEMNAHHYFRDFSYCDSGMIPWLQIAERINNTSQTLSSLVDERIRAFPCSGEINFTVSDSKVSIERILAYYSVTSPLINRTDGVNLEFPEWRFNLRASNNEPLFRLNVESRRITN